METPVTPTREYRSFLGQGRKDKSPEEANSWTKIKKIDSFEKDEGGNSFQIGARNKLFSSDTSKPLSLSSSMRIRNQTEDININQSDSPLKPLKRNRSRSSNACPTKGLIFKHFYCILHL